MCFCTSFCWVFFLFVGAPHQTAQQLPFCTILFFTFFRRHFLSPLFVGLGRPNGTSISFVGLGHLCGHFGTLVDLFWKFFHLWVNRFFFPFVGLGHPQNGTSFSLLGWGHPCGHFGTLVEIFLKFFHLWVNRTFFSFVGLGRRAGHFETIAISTPPIQRPEAAFGEKNVTDTHTDRHTPLPGTIQVGWWAYPKISQYIKSLTPFGHFTVWKKAFPKSSRTSAGDHHIIIICLSIDERTMGIVIFTISVIPKYPTGTERCPLPCRPFRHGYFEYEWIMDELLFLSDSKFCPASRTIPNSPLRLYLSFVGDIELNYDMMHERE